MTIRQAFLVAAQLELKSLSEDRLKETFRVFATFYPNLLDREISPDAGKAILEDLRVRIRTWDAKVKAGYATDLHKIVSRN